MTVLDLVADGPILHVQEGGARHRLRLSVHALLLAAALLRPNKK